MGLIAEKPRKPKIDVPEFLATPRNNIVFSPEYQQKHFFFIVVDNIPFDSKPNTLIREQAQVSKEILNASKDTRCTIFLSSEKDLEIVKNAYFTACPELAKLHRDGRLEFRVGKYTGEMWARDLGNPSFANSSTRPQ